MIGTAAALIGSAVIGGIASNSASRRAAGAANAATAAQTDAAVQSNEIAREQLGLAREESEAARARQAQFDPRFMQIIEQQMASQGTQDARSAEQWQQYRDVFMPAERRLADAAANYDTPERRALEAEGAVTAVDQQFGKQREAQQRQLGRTGSSMTANRALTLDAASRFANAKASATADRGARRQVEATGMSLTDNVVKTGRGIASTGLQAAGLALNAGQGASNTLGQQQGTYNASMGPSQQLYQGAQAGTGQAAGIYGNVAGNYLDQQQIANQGAAGLGSLAGRLLTAPTDNTGGSLWGSIINSSKDVKYRIGPVSGKKARLSLEDAPVERWKYKKGVADEAEHIGPYVEDMKGSGATKGKTLDVISTLGLHHAAIADMSRDVKAIKKAVAPKRGRYSLADVDDIESREVA